MADRPTWSGPAPDDITPWLIVRAGHAVGQRFWAAMATVGLTPVQFGVLLQLDRHPDLSNAEIARAVLVTPQAMSELMAGLEARGLVARDRSVGPGRRVPTRLTPAGRRTLRRCVAVVADVERGLGLSPRQAQVLRSTLRGVLAPDGP